jgi:hypothetical protein
MTLYTLKGFSPDSTQIMAKAWVFSIVISAINGGVIISTIPPIHQGI